MISAICPPRIRTHLNPTSYTQMGVRQGVVHMFPGEAPGT